MPSPLTLDSANLQALLRGVGLSLAVLALAWTSGPWSVPGPEATIAPAAQAPAAAATANTAAQGSLSGLPRQQLVLPAHAAQAHFGAESASAEARQVALWAFRSGDHGSRAVVVVDKKEAKVYVFGPGGELQGATPALMGSAIGDHTVPGIGDKPIAQVLPSERTTPAGRFVAEPGTNADGEDVVWVDYDAAVSMHRVRPTVKAERRLERLASATPEDNRISYGCINLPVPFYENVLSPLVRRTGAVVYVLPETEPAARRFGGAQDMPVADATALR